MVFSLYCPVPVARLSHGKITHSTKLVILECLLDLCSTVHHEWAMTNDRFIEWLSVHHQQLGVPLGLHQDPIASSGKKGEIAFACRLSVNFDFSTQDKESCGMAIRQRQFSGLASAKIHIPQVNRSKRLGRPLDVVKFTGNDANRSAIFRQLDIWNLPLRSVW